jgi:hypothetical protein
MLQKRQMNVLTRKSGRLFTVASILAYALVLLYGSVFAFEHPASDGMSRVARVLVESGRALLAADRSAGRCQRNINPARD